MIQILTIPHRLPSYNEYVGRTIRQYYTRRKKEIEESIWIEIVGAKLKPMPYAYLYFVWCEPDKRRNKDNILSAEKFILDALVKTKIFKNDGWSEILGLYHDFMCLPDDNGHVTITLSTGKL